MDTSESNSGEVSEEIEGEVSSTCDENVLHEEDASESPEIVSSDCQPFVVVSRGGEQTEAGPSLSPDTSGEMLRYIGDGDNVVCVPFDSGEGDPNSAHLQEGIEPVDIQSELGSLPGLRIGDDREIISIEENVLISTTIEEGDYAVLNWEGEEIIEMSTSETFEELEQQIRQSVDVSSASNHSSPSNVDPPEEISTETRSAFLSTNADSTTATETRETNNNIVTVVREDEVSTTGEEIGSISTSQTASTSTATAVSSDTSLPGPSRVASSLTAGRTLASPPGPFSPQNSGISSSNPEQSSSSMRFPMSTVCTVGPQLQDRVSSSRDKRNEHVHAQESRIDTTSVQSQSQSSAGQSSGVSSASDRGQQKSTPKPISAAGSSGTSKRPSSEAVAAAAAAAAEASHMAVTKPVEIAKPLPSGSKAAASETSQSKVDAASKPSTCSQGALSSSVVSCSTARNGQSQGQGQTQKPGTSVQLAGTSKHLVSTSGSTSAASGPQLPSSLQTPIRRPGSGPSRPSAQAQVAAGGRLGPQQPAQPSVGGLQGPTPAVSSSALAAGMGGSQSQPAKTPPPKSTPSSASGSAAAAAAAAATAARPTVSTSGLSGAAGEASRPRPPVSQAALQQQLPAKPPTQQGPLQERSQASTPRPSALPSQIRPSQGSAGTVVPKPSTSSSVPALHTAAKPAAPGPARKPASAPLKPLASGSGTTAKPVQGQSSKPAVLSTAAKSTATPSQTPKAPASTAGAVHSAASKPTTSIQSQAPKIPSPKPGTTQSQTEKPLITMAGAIAVPKLPTTHNPPAATTGATVDVIPKPVTQAQGPKLATTTAECTVGQASKPSPAPKPSADSAGTVPVHNPASTQGQSTKTGTTGTASSPDVKPAPSRRPAIKSPAVSTGTSLGQDCKSTEFQGQGPKPLTATTATSPSPAPDPSLRLPPGQPAKQPVSSLPEATKPNSGPATKPAPGLGANTSGQVEKPTSGADEDRGAPVTPIIKSSVSSASLTPSLAAKPAATANTASKPTTITSSKLKSASESPKHVTTTDAPASPVPVSKTCGVPSTSSKIPSTSSVTPAGLSSKSTTTTVSAPTTKASTSAAPAPTAKSVTSSTSTLLPIDKNGTAGSQTPVIKSATCSTSTSGKTSVTPATTSKPAPSTNQSLVSKQAPSNAPDPGKDSTLSSPTLSSKPGTTDTLTPASKIITSSHPVQTSKVITSSTTSGSKTNTTSDSNLPTSVTPEPSEKPATTPPASGVPSATTKLSTPSQAPKLPASGASTSLATARTVTTTTPSSSKPHASGTPSSKPITSLATKLPVSSSTTIAGKPGTKPLSSSTLPKPGPSATATSATKAGAVPGTAARSLTVPTQRPAAARPGLQGGPRDAAPGAGRAQPGGLRGSTSTHIRPIVAAGLQARPATAPRPAGPRSAPRGPSSVIARPLTPLQQQDQRTPVKIPPRPSQPQSKTESSEPTTSTVKNEEQPVKSTPSTIRHPSGTDTPPTKSKSAVAESVDAKAATETPPTSSKDTSSQKPKNTVQNPQELGHAETAQGPKSSPPVDITPVNLQSQSKKPPHEELLTDKTQTPTTHAQGSDSPSHRVVEPPLVTEPQQVTPSETARGSDPKAAETKLGEATTSEAEKPCAFQPQITSTGQKLEDKPSEIKQAPESKPHTHRKEPPKKIEKLTEGAVKRLEEKDTTSIAKLPKPKPGEAVSLSSSSNPIAAVVESQSQGSEAAPKGLLKIADKPSRAQALPRVEQVSSSAKPDPDLQQRPSNVKSPLTVKVEESPTTGPKLSPITLKLVKESEGKGGPSEYISLSPKLDSSKDSEKLTLKLKRVGSPTVRELESEDKVDKLTLKLRKDSNRLEGTVSSTTAVSDVSAKAGDGTDAEPKVGKLMLKLKDTEKGIVARISKGSSSDIPQAAANIEDEPKVEKLTLKLKKDDTSQALSKPEEGPLKVEKLTLKLRVDSPGLSQEAADSSEEPKVEKLMLKLKKDAADMPSPKDLCGQSSPRQEKLMLRLRKDSTSSDPSSGPEVWKGEGGGDSGETERITLTLVKDADNSVSVKDKDSGDKSADVGSAANKEESKVEKLTLKLKKDLGTRDSSPATEKAVSSSVEAGGTEPPKVEKLTLKLKPGVDETTVVRADSSVKQDQKAEKAIGKEEQKVEKLTLKLRKEDTNIQEKPLEEKVEKLTLKLKKEPEVPSSAGEKSDKQGREVEEGRPRPASSALHQELQADVDEPLEKITIKKITGCSKHGAQYKVQTLQVPAEPGEPEKQPQAVAAGEDAAKLTLKLSKASAWAVKVTGTGVEPTDTITGPSPSKRARPDDTKSAPAAVSSPVPASKAPAPALALAAALAAAPASVPSSVPASKAPAPAPTTSSLTPAPTPAPKATAPAQKTTTPASPPKATARMTTSITTSPAPTSTSPPPAPTTTTTPPASPQATTVSAPAPFPASVPKATSVPKPASVVSGRTPGKRSDPERVDLAGPSKRYKMEEKLTECTVVVKEINLPGMSPRASREPRLRSPPAVPGPGESSMEGRLREILSKIGGKASALLDCDVSISFASQADTKQAPAPPPPSPAEDVEIIMVPGGSSGASSTGRGRGRGRARGHSSRGGHSQVYRPHPHTQQLVVEPDIINIEPVITLETGDTLADSGMSPGAGPRGGRARKARGRPRKSEAGGRPALKPDVALASAVPASGHASATAPTLASASSPAPTPGPAPTPARTITIPTPMLLDASRPKRPCRGRERPFVEPKKPRGRGAGIARGIGRKKKDQPGGDMGPLPGAPDITVFTVPAVATTLTAALALDPASAARGSRKDLPTLSIPLTPVLGPAAVPRAVGRRGRASSRAAARAAARAARAARAASTATVPTIDLEHDQADSPEVEEIPAPSASPSPPEPVEESEPTGPELDPEVEQESESAFFSTSASPSPGANATDSPLAGFGKQLAGEVEEEEEEGPAVGAGPGPEAVLLDEETRMSADNSGGGLGAGASGGSALGSPVPPPPPPPLPPPGREDEDMDAGDEMEEEGAAAPGEESQGSAVSSATGDSSSRRKLRMEVDTEGAKEVTVEQLAEYQWPVDSSGEPLMLQEQVAEYLGVKSFKRKYPDLRRRPVEAEEKTFLREKGMVSDALSDMGLTAISSAEVLDIMFTDFPEKYEEYRRHMRERQAKELSLKQKLIAMNAAAERTRHDYRERASSSAATWNTRLNRARREGRRACFDLQNLAVHFPQSRARRMTRETPRIGHYPIALIPGQYTDYYRSYTPAELRYFPLNTVLYGPMKPNERQEPSGGSDGSQSESDDSSSSDESSSSSSSEGTQDTEETGSTAGDTEPADGGAGSGAPGPSAGGGGRTASSTGSSGRAASAAGSSGRASSASGGSGRAASTAGSSGRTASSAPPHTSATARVLAQAPAAQPKDRPAPAAVSCVCRVCEDEQPQGRPSPETFVRCASCRSAGHPSCLELSADMVPYVRRYAWQCTDCKICVQCQDPADEDKMLFCDMCDRGYHIYCVGLRRVPGGRWHCRQCGVCGSCGVSQPGGSSGWHHEGRKGTKGTARVYAQTLCSGCIRLWRKGRYCPLCYRCFIGGQVEESDLITCRSCDKTMHADCCGGAVSRLHRGNFLCEPCQERAPVKASSTLKLTMRPVVKV